MYVCMYIWVFECIYLYTEITTELHIYQTHTHNNESNMKRPNQSVILASHWQNKKGVKCRAALGHHFYYTRHSTPLHSTSVQSDRLLTITLPWGKFLGLHTQPGIKMQTNEMNKFCFLLIPHFLSIQWTTNVCYEQT